jgi:hypothetical protein
MLVVISHHIAHANTYAVRSAHGVCSFTSPFDALRSKSLKSWVRAGKGGFGTFFVWKKSNINHTLKRSAVEWAHALLTGI